MSSTPKISVLMTVFNCERYVLEAIESILKQSFQDFEFIIIDNKSTDKTSQIISSFNDERIVFIQNEDNLGQTRALNIGLRRSRASYIARIDADDIAYPERLQIQYDFLECHPDIAVVGSWSLDIDSKGRPIKIFKSPTDPLEIKCFLSASGDLTCWCVSHPTVLMKKKVIEQVGLYREEKTIYGYPQDYELWSRMIAKGFRFANIAKPLLKYRILENSESRGTPEELLQLRMDITQNRIKNILPQLTARDVLCLANMLEFRPQNCSEEGKQVLQIFDRYFNAFLDENNFSKTVLRLKNKIKLYYVPQLFKTNKLLSIKKFVQLILFNPLFLLDMRFYHKILKVLLPNIFQRPSHHFFLFKYILSGENFRSSTLN